MNSFSRRDVLTGALGSAAVLSIAGVPAFAREAAQEITATPLADHILLVTGAGANVVAVRGPDGLLLIDGGLEDRSAALLRFVKKQLDSKRIHTLINTHWHPEQTGSNRRLGADGAKIIAHENTKLWLTRKITVSWREGSYGPLPERARPNETTYTTGSLQVGDETVQYGYMVQAHTDGDLYVYLPKSNILITGGVVSADGWPIVDYETGGWIGGLVGGYNKLIAVANDETRVVPANGPMITRKDLVVHRDMYKTIYERLVKSLTSGLSPEEALALEPAKEFAPQWGDPRQFLTMAFKSMWGHFAPDA